VHFSPCGEIGRHARLKTLSFMGPGSSPGTGNINIYFKKKVLGFSFTALSCLSAFKFNDVQLVDMLIRVFVSTASYVPAFNLSFNFTTLHVVFILKKKF
jgi:hypothetical protein